MQDKTEIAGRRWRATVCVAAATVAACAVAAAPIGAAPRATTETAAPAWQPLAAGEYHHVAFTSFTPRIPATKSDPRKDVDQLLRFDSPSAEEFWLDRDGRGMSLRVMGGTGDATKYPTFQRDKQGRFTGGMGPTVAPDRPVVSFNDSLRYPDTVSVTTRQAANPNAIRERFWGRTPAGFVKLRQWIGAPKLLAVGNTQLRTWGARRATLDRLNAADTRSTREAALGVVLDDREPYGGAWPIYGEAGRAGMTRTSIRREGRMYQAAKLLARAPLAPAARTATLGWLTRQPGVTVTTNASDDAGRRGTRLTFTTQFDRVVPATSVRVSALVAAAIQRGEVPRDTTLPERTIGIAKHREYRRVYLTLLLEPTTNEVLESVYYERWADAARRPVVTTTGKHGRPGGKPRLAIQWGQVRPLGGFEAHRYGVHERTTTITPIAAVCLDHPDVCH